ncbi:ComEA family DNA-binding protein [Phytomonospora endophytica]|uniref:Helix-hairpin-helix domain-containing protein n=1 Tax=Phytomonospora endophytica TaxID=714109 RepID=A0A841F8F6_9ACTN|nr:helix-hairpin-helix domain-containing protein [Phytomonospora endophytica]MBB6033361.1 hypothetical protein [Phytomonospora endophytica]GIG70867.1 hypothetical protein Pen01_71620 [Phytomonospora endophytica]
MRILVLGTGPGAANARRLAHERGLRLARHALDSVTYIVADDTVNPRDPKLVAARALGVHVVPDTEFVNQPEQWPAPRDAADSAVAPMGHHGGRPSGHHPRSPHGHPRSPQVQQAMDSLFKAINNADPTAIREALRQFGSILWALSPLLTGGLSAPIIFGHAAAKLKSVVAGIAAFLYAGMAIAYITLFAMDAQKLDDGQFANVNPLAMISLFALMLGGTAHAFMIRNKMFPRAEGDDTPRRVIPADDAEARVLARRERRARARRLLADDPAMADELGIGRPDLDLGYDDGGLVDVNHAPAEILATMRGVDAKTAERIVTMRELSGPFASVAELVVRADLDPDAVRLVEEYAVFG